MSMQPASPSNAGSALDGRPSMPYLDALEAALTRSRSANVDSIAAAARIVERTVLADGIVYVFGCGHSQLAALELSRRAGGLASLQVIYDPTWGAAEAVPGFGATLLADVTFQAADCLLVVSNSGATAAPLEVAAEARSRGVPVIAVTSLAAAAPGAAASGAAARKSRRLALEADVVLDNGASCGDAAIEVGDLAPNLGPTSTVVAASLLHEVVVDAVASLARVGVEAPVLRPNAQAGGREHNARLFERYRGRLRRVP